MTIVLVVLCIWGCSALIRAYSAKQSQREFQRIDSEIRQRKLEQKQMAQELAQQKRDAELYVRKQIALEREQMKLAKEQAKQAEQIARHEEQLARLEQQVSLAEREIAHYQPIVDELRREAEGLAFKVSYFEGRGLPCAGYKTQLERVNEKLYRMETKVIKAENTKQNAQRKLA